MKDIHILFYAPSEMRPPEEAYGYAFVYEYEDYYIVDYYQSRLNLAKPEEEMLEEIFEWSKMWSEDCYSVVDAINKARAFWFRERLIELPEIKTYESIAEAVRENPGAEEIYFYQELKKDKKIWFRVGMELSFTEENYARIIAGGLTQGDILLAIRSGDAVLTGETYAPDINDEFKKSEIAVEAEGVTI